MYNKKVRILPLEPLFIKNHEWEKNFLQRNILRKKYLALHFYAKKISGLFA